jgi:trans-aconitate methyltransferase
MNNKIKWNSDHYQENYNFVYKYGSEVMRWLAPKAGEKILDLGCGTGQLTNELASMGVETIGIDSSQEMVYKATKNYPHLLFLREDASHFESHTSFDAVFSNAVLHWVFPPEKAAVCIFNVLKDGGRFIAEFGGQDNVKMIIDALRISMETRKHRMADPEKLWFFPSIGIYTSILEEAGFHVIKAEHIDRPTQLKDPETGIKDWFEMFGDFFFNDLSTFEKEEVLEDIQEILRPTHYRDGKWFADYKRLRIKAVKPN